MSNSGSTGSYTDSTGHNIQGNYLQIPNYHFKSQSISSLAYGENVEIVFGYRISNKLPVVAKISGNSLKLEREYYVARKLFQLTDGECYLVRPLDYIHLSTGLTVVIYADEGHNYFNCRPSDESGIQGVTASRDDYHYPSREGPIFDLGTFLRFAIKCTDCLEFIHKNNVVHGEIRMSAFQWSGEDSSSVKLWNFGSGSKSFEAYLTSESWRKIAHNLELVQSLQNMLSFMSPEQLGRTTYVPDHRSDLYSLGTVFFVLLTGKMPFDGGPLETLNSIISRKMPLVNEIQLDVPEVIGRLIEKMTNKSPIDRYNSAYGVGVDLRKCLESLCVSSESISEMIELFPLAEKDVTAVFTLPKTVYGRQHLIAEMSCIIQCTVNNFKPKSKKEATHSSGSNAPTITSSSELLYQYSISDHASESCISNPDLSSICTGGKSATSPSFYSGSERSNNASKLTGFKQGAVMVCLSGPGGVGKSTMFNSVQTMARQEGYVASAKFDSRHKAPYSCVLKSLSHIMQQILSEPEEDIHLFYNHLKIHLGTQFCKIELLADLVPELKPLLDPVDSEDSVNTIHLDNVEMRARFHNLFIEVFRALTQWKMITLFLDDLHLADEPSIEIIESIISSRLNILIFLAYREEEMTGPLDRLLCNDVAIFHHFRVDLLDTEAVLEYISDTLHHPADTSKEFILPLAEIIYRKTRGNAFYTGQLLTTLERKKHIFFNWEENRWDYNLAEIQQLILIHGGTEREEELDINFLVSRLRELPADGQRLLKWASFVGDTFSWKTVKNLIQSDLDSEFSDTCSVFSDSTARETYSSQPNPSYYQHIGTRDPMIGLQAALQEGYILPLESDEFKWSHDRYSQAAMELAKPKSRERIHLKIARYLLDDENIDYFLVADHLIKCIDLLYESDDRRHYQNIFHEAGNKARNSGAHKIALEYYKASIALLDTRPWEPENYAMTHFLYTNAVSLCLAVGEHEKTEDYLRTIFEHTVDPLHRVTAYRIQYKYYFSRQMHKKGADTLHTCLKELEINDFKYAYTREELDEEFECVRNLIERMSFEALRKMGACDDNKLRAIMGILEEICTANYWLGNQIQMFYLATKIVRISFEHGVSPSSGIGLVYMGIAAADMYSMFELGEELGMMGFMITEKFGSNSEKGRTGYLYANFLLAWKSHQKEQHQWFKTSHRLSLSSGDRIYAAFSQLNLATTLFFSGKKLSVVLAEAEQCYSDIYSWSTSADSNILIMAVIRTIKSLQGNTFSQLPDNIFDGQDGFSDHHFVSESCKPSAKPAVPMNWYDSFRMLPLVLYGHYEHAIAVGYMCIRGIHNHPGHRHTRMLLYLHSLAIIEKIRSERLDQELVKSYRGRVSENQALLKLWVDCSPINFSMWHTLVRAELSSLDNDIQTSIELYERAIEEAREGEWFLELCICHEYAGAFYVRKGIKNAAYGLLKKAISLYIRHESYGKAKHLEIKYADFFSSLNDSLICSQDVGVQTDPFPFLGPQSPWSTCSLPPNNTFSESAMSEVIPPVTTEQTLMTLDILDLASILKSSQVISSEVKFDLLLKAMMSIILENSGADCGAIMIKEEKYGIYAYGNQQEGAMTFDPPRALSEKDDLICSRIVNHTINTNESIFIHNIEQDARFALGSWYKNTGNKSVICMPIVYKGTMVGCLFIEGSAGIFSQRQITVLSLLCQQMGISISNAFLFKSVQRVTMANVRMIEIQKKALEDARRSREAAVKATHLREIFLANMSHEIRTPFSGFYGMISLLADTQLDTEQRDLVKTAKESCEILLQIIDDLLNFSKLQAGKVTLDISPIVVEDIVADVVEMLIAMAIQKDINVTYIVTNDVPTIVMADGNRLRQILINLLGNAIKFTHEGEICIQCSRDKSKKERGDQVSLLFEVIDTGIGISNEQRKALFEPFSQVDGSTTRKYGGTGLGLSICLQLVELMSGSIDVTSVPNKGSNFFFSIRVLNVQSNAREPDSYTQEQKNLLRNLTLLKVLVFSECKASVEMIRHFLPGIHVDGADKTELVEKMTRRVQYDVIVIGLAMISEDPSWLLEVCQKHKDVLVVIMNYPAGGLMPKKQELVPKMPLGCKMVRMAIPIRRLRLLKTINEAMNFTTLASSSTNTMVNLNPLITEKERKMYNDMCILIAEDNPVAQKLLLKQLTRLGFHVECANNGLEAINAWTSRPSGHFVMAFFDHHMPKCDGVEATKIVREIEKKEKRTIRLPIVALTADVQESARHVCINAGMDGYLTKPLNQKVLTESLRNYCLPDK